MAKKPQTIQNAVEASHASRPTSPPPTSPPPPRKKPREVDAEAYSQVKAGYELLLRSYQELREAFLETLDGNSRWYEIQHATGMSDWRCKEIEALFEKCKRGVV